MERNNNKSLIDNETMKAVFKRFVDFDCDKDSINPKYLHKDVAMNMFKCSSAFSAFISLKVMSETFAAYESVISWDSTLFAMFFIESVFVFLVLRFLWAYALETCGKKIQNSEEDEKIGYLDSEQVKTEPFKRMIFYIVGVMVFFVSKL